MYKYERIIYWSDEDNAFIVEIPELPGCMADGRTVEEAIANAKIIIKEWIEVTIERGLEKCEPFDYTEWQADLFEGTSLDELEKKAMEFYSLGNDD